jgi:hypothetical protein
MIRVTKTLTPVDTTDRISSVRVLLPFCSKSQALRHEFSTHCSQSLVRLSTDLVRRRGSAMGISNRPNARTRAQLEIHAAREKQKQAISVPCLKVPPMYVYTVDRRSLPMETLIRHCAGWQTKIGFWSNLSSQQRRRGPRLMPKLAIAQCAYLIVSRCGR